MYSVLSVYFSSKKDLTTDEDKRKFYLLMHIPTYCSYIFCFYMYQSQICLVMKDLQSLLKHCMVGEVSSH